MLNVSAYLDRIGYLGQIDPSAETLRGLHLAHMLAVPFENLDIHLGRLIPCDEARFLHKIIDERRGGFCYELNGAFAALLRALGFKVTLLSARVTLPDGSGAGPEFDHLTLRVDVHEDEPWLADVGFGDNFLEPLRLVSKRKQPQAGHVYRLMEERGCVSSRIANQRSMEETIFVHAAAPPTQGFCRHVPLPPDFARVPFHSPANLLARHAWMDASHYPN